MKVAVAALLLLAFVSPARADGGSVVVRRGEAFAPDSGRLLWVEEHRETWVDGRPQKAEVVYSSPEKKPFAKKTVSFGRFRGTPDFRLEDSRDGYLEGIESGPRGLRLFCRRKSGKPVEEAVLGPATDLVADAGAEEYIKLHWDRLISGEKLEFRFAVPFERDFFRFHVKKVGVTKKDGRDLVRFRMSIANPLLRAVAAPIETTWDLAAKRVLVYEGITAINDHRGKSHVARVVYSY